jgi:predicted protein tyrosine phosphatase
MAVPKSSKLQQRLNGTNNIQGRSFSVKPPTVLSAAQKEANQKALDAPKRVIFMSRQEAEYHPFDLEDVLISICDTGVAAPTLIKEPKERIVVDFHDYVSRGGEAAGHHWITHEQAMEIAQFVQKHTDVRNIMVHCNYGESRSKAVAMAIHHHKGRSILRSNSNGIIVPYQENSDVGNQRVYSLVSDMLLHASEEDFA